MFAHLLGIRPWEIGRLTTQEFANCQAWVDNYQAEQRKKAGRRG